MGLIQSHVEMIYRGFHFVMGGTPNHPVVMDDHDFVLKPMVTLGSPHF